MKAIFLVLLAAIVVYCTAKPLKIKEPNFGAGVAKNGPPLFKLKLNGKKFGAVPGEFPKKSFPGFKGLSTLDGKLMKEQNEKNRRTKAAPVTQFRKFDKRILQNLEAMRNTFGQYQKIKGGK